MDLATQTEILMTDKTAIKKHFSPHDHLNVGLISEYSYRYSYEYLDLLMKQTNCPFQYCSLVSQAEVEPTVYFPRGTGTIRKEVTGLQYSCQLFTWSVVEYNKSCPHILLTL